MKFSEFEHEFLPRCCIPLLGGLFVLGALHSAARAETPTPAVHSFVVSAADGYGVNDCIKSGEDCAKIVADAWCEAHGHGEAKKFGPVNDITASIRPVAAKVAAAAPAVGEDAVFISCSE